MKVQCERNSPNAPVRDDKAKRDGEARNGERRHEKLLDEPRRPVVRLCKKVRGGNANDERYREARERDEK